MKKRLVVFTAVREVEVNEHASEAEIIETAHNQVQTEIDNGTFAFTQTEVKHVPEAIGAEA